jgi:hypothetical protein
MKKVVLIGFIVGITVMLGSSAMAVKEYGNLPAPQNLMCGLSDTDGDGLLVSIEAGLGPTNPEDTDTDGTPDYLDLDSDNDGWYNYEEVATNTDPLDPNDHPSTILTVYELGMIIFFGLLVGLASWVMMRRKRQESA